MKLSEQAPDVGKRKAYSDTPEIAHKPLRAFCVSLTLCMHMPSAKIEGPDLMWHFSGKEVD